MQNPIPINDLIASVTREIVAQKSDQSVLVGIHTGGALIAEQIHQTAEFDTPLGSIDISFYRDDFSKVGLQPEVKASELPFDVEDSDIILIDDVLQTGRTIRAALNEIFSYGRPRSVTLAVLIERPGRELPIQASIIGQSMDLDADHHIKLTQKGKQLDLKVITRGD